MYLTENLQEKWQDLFLEHPDLKIEDSYKEDCYYCYLGKLKKQLEKIRHFYQKQR